MAKLTDRKDILILIEKISKYIQDDNNKIYNTCNDKFIVDFYKYNTISFTLDHSDDLIKKYFKNLFVQNQLSYVLNKYVSDDTLEIDDNDIIVYREDDIVDVLYSKCTCINRLNDGQLIEENKYRKEIKTSLKINLTSYIDIDVSFVTSFYKVEDVRKENVDKFQSTFGYNRLSVDIVNI